MPRPDIENYKDSMSGILRYSTAQDKYIDHLESRLAEIAEIMDYCLECFGSQYLPLHDKLIEAKTLAKGE